MTNNQKESLSRVQASVTRYQYVESESGTYRTEDLATVLEYVDSLSAKLEAVKEDLLEIKEWGMSDEEYNQTTLDMINSTLMFLGEE